DGSDLGGDPGGIVQQYTLRQFQNADRAAHQREEALHPAAIITADAARLPLLVGIEPDDIVVEVAQQAIEDFHEVLAAPAPHTGEEIIGADMPEKSPIREEVAPQQGGEEGDGMVAHVEAVMIVERLEMVEVAIAEEARLLVVAAGLLHEIADGVIAGQPR